MTQRFRRVARGLRRGGHAALLAGFALLASAAFPQQETVEPEEKAAEPEEERGLPRASDR